MSNKTGTKKIEKAGIIAGIVCLILCVVVFTLVSKKTKEPEIVEEPPVTQVEEVQNAPETVESTQETQQPEVTTAPEVTTPVQETPKVVDTSNVIEIDEGTMGEPNNKFEILVRIAKKSILLLDRNPSGTDNKMLTYCFETFGPNGENLTVFITKSVYESYNVNDTLLVEYEVYRNANNIDFPIVVSVKDATISAPTENQTVVEENSEQQ